MSSDEGIFSKQPVVLGPISMEKNNNESDNTNKQSSPSSQTKKSLKPKTGFFGGVINSNSVSGVSHGSNYLNPTVDQNVDQRKVSSFSFPGITHKEDTLGQTENNQSSAKEESFTFSADSKASEEDSNQTSKFGFDEKGKFGFDFGSHNIDNQEPSFHIGNDNATVSSEPKDTATTPFTFGKDSQSPTGFNFGINTNQGSFGTSNNSGVNLFTFDIQSDSNKDTSGFTSGFSFLKSDDKRESNIIYGSDNATVSSEPKTSNFLFGTNDGENRKELPDKDKETTKKPKSQTQFPPSFVGHNSEVNDEKQASSTTPDNVFDTMQLQSGGSSPGDDMSQEQESSSGDDVERVLIFPKIVFQSHQNFLDLHQCLEKCTDESSRKEEIKSACKVYRSILKEQFIDEHNDLETKKLALAQEKIFHFFQIFFLEQNGMILPLLLELYDEYGRIHPDIESWTRVYQLIICGRRRQALEKIDFLVASGNSELNPNQIEVVESEKFREIFEIPILDMNGSKPLTMNTFHRWQYKVDSFYPLDGPLGTIFQILRGDPVVINQHATSWLEAMIGDCLYNDPLCSRSDMQQMSKKLYKKIPSGTNNTLEEIFYKLLEKETIPSALLTIHEYFGSWMSFHFIELVHHNGVFPRIKLRESGLTYREEFTVRFVEDLKTLGSETWKLCLDYFSIHADKFVKKMEDFLAELDISSEEQFSKVLKYCKRFPFLLPKIQLLLLNRGEFYLGLKRYASAIHYFLEAGNYQKIIAMLDQAIENDAKENLDHNRIFITDELKSVAESINNLPLKAVNAFTRNLILQKLEFIHNYVQIMEFQQRKDHRSCVKRIMNVLNVDNVVFSNIPKSSLLIMMTIVKELLVSHKNLFSKEDTLILMQALETVMCSEFDSPLSANQIQMIRITLLQHYQNAIIVQDENMPLVHNCFNC